MPIPSSRGEAKIPLDDEEECELLEKGQTCLGEATEVERVLDSKCPCLRSKCLHFSWTFLLYAVAVIVLVFFCRQYLKGFLKWLQHLNKWVSGLIFVVMFTLVSFPMTWGYIVLNMAAGYLYGFVAGLLTVTISVVVGVTVSVIICRYFLRSLVQSKLQSSHLKAIIQVIESRRGFKVVILTRLTPIPFGLQNGLFAVSQDNIYSSYCTLYKFEYEYDVINRHFILRLTIPYYSKVAYYSTVTYYSAIRPIKKIHLVIFLF